MAQFKFKLDFLIKARQRKEEKAILALNERLASIRQLEEHINYLYDNKNSLNNELKEKISRAGVNAATYVMYKDYEAQLKKQIDRAEELMRLSRKEEAKEREAVVKATIDRKIIEKLKEKQYELFKLEQAYLDQINLEELASLASARKRLEEELADNKL